MNSFYISISVIVCSTALAWALLQIFVVFPAWRNMKAQKARADLAKCFRILNEGPFQDGTITNGHQLHDVFYQKLFKFLMIDELKLMPPKNIVHTAADEERCLVFREEVEALDPEMWAVVRRAVYAMGILVWLQNIVDFPTHILRVAQARQIYDRQYRNEQMMRSGEYAAMTPSHDSHHCGPGCVCPA